MGVLTSGGCCSGWHCNEILVGVPTFVASFVGPGYSMFGATGGTSVLVTGTCRLLMCILLLLFLGRGGGFLACGGNFGIDLGLGDGSLLPRLAIVLT